VYAIPDVSTRHRVVKLDIPAPRWMRAPGEAPGTFALESAMDEVAYALEIDPVELRIISEPAADAETGTRFSAGKRALVTGSSSGSATRSLWVWRLRA
jgi:xanthine dehydrogenase YagR molybdenum-binding subunit